MTCSCYSGLKCVHPPRRGAVLARGATVLRQVRWGMFLFMVLGCLGQEEQPGARVNSFFIRKWKVPADFMDRISHFSSSDPVEVEVEDDPFADRSGGCVFYHSLPDIFEHQLGIPFPAGTTTEFSPNRGELIVKNTEASLGMIDKLVASQGTMEVFVLEDDLFTPI